MEQKYRFQFCEAFQDKHFKTTKTQEGYEKAVTLQKKTSCCGRPFLSSLGKRETSDALTGKQTA